MIVNKLRILLRTRGILPSALAARIGRSKQWVYSLLPEDKHLATATREVLCATLHCKVEDLEVYIPDRLWQETLAKRAAAEKQRAKAFEDELAG